MWCILFALLEFQQRPQASNKQYSALEQVKTKPKTNPKLFVELLTVFCFLRILVISSDIFLAALSSVSRGVKFNLSSTLCVFNHKTQIFLLDSYVLDKQYV